MTLTREQLQALADKPMTVPTAYGSRPKKGGRGKAKGYAATPGSGPAGETCRSCSNLRSVQGGNRKFYKCALRTWTHGKATDVLIGSPACAMWRKRDG